VSLLPDAAAGVQRQKSDWTSSTYQYCIVAIAEKASVLTSAPATRDILLQILREAVGGDQVVAEYLLMHILSFVYVAARIADTAGAVAPQPQRRSDQSLL
jgi:hypothetical protein